MKMYWDRRRGRPTRDNGSVLFQTAGSSNDCTTHSQGEYSWSLGSWRATQAQATAGDSAWSLNPSEQLKHGGSGDHSWSLGSRRATQARETTGDHASSVPVDIPPPVNDAGTPCWRSYPSNTSSIGGDILIVQPSRDKRELWKTMGRMPVDSLMPVLRARNSTFERMGLARENLPSGRCLRE